MKKRCGKGMLVLLMAALVSVGGLGAACFFSRQAGKEKFQEEEAEKLKAEREYLEAGAPEKAQCHLVKTLSRCIPIRQR